MATIRSLQTEADEFTRKAQLARDEAGRLQKEAAKDTFNEDEVSAMRGAMSAQEKQKEAEDFEAKANAKRDEIARLQSEVERLQMAVSENQQKINQITG